jgi:hypothetical protein
MCDMGNKLKELDMAISDGFLVHFIMTSLPPQCSPFKISYNTQKGTWNIAELISYYVEEEERRKAKKGKNVTNLVGFNNPSKNQAKSRSNKQPKKKFKNNKVNKTTSHKNAQDAKVCKFFKSPKLLQKQCTTFKKWLKNKGTDVVSFIDESFLTNFAPNTWWINSGATMHISNSLQAFSSMRTIRRGSEILELLMEMKLKSKALETSH